MGTRSGDLDPAVVPFLAERLSIGVTDVEDVLNRKSGLLGLAGVADLRAVNAAADDGDERAQLALKVRAFASLENIELGAYMPKPGHQTSAQAWASNAAPQLGSVAVHVAERWFSRILFRAGVCAPAAALPGRIPAAAGACGCHHLQRGRGRALAGDPAAHAGRPAGTSSSCVCVLQDAAWSVCVRNTSSTVLELQTAAACQMPRVRRSASALSWTRRRTRMRWPRRPLSTLNGQLCRCE